MQKYFKLLTIAITLLAVSACGKPEYILVKPENKTLHGVYVYHMSNTAVQGMNSMNGTSHKHGGFLIYLRDQTVDTKFSKVYISSNELIKYVLLTAEFKDANTILFSSSENGYTQRELSDRAKLFEYCRQNNITIYINFFDRISTKSEYKHVVWQ